MFIIYTYQQNQRTYIWTQEYSYERQFVASLISLKKNNLKR